MHTTRTRARPRFARVAEGLTRFRRHGDDWTPARTKRDLWPAYPGQLPPPPAVLA
jgi:hypothetical protein